jgi:hypothetical protein
MPTAEIFDEPKGDLPDHYASIGRLITGFSNIERALNEVIRAEADRRRIPHRRRGASGGGVDTGLAKDVHEGRR